jgi:hypothetical protein
VEASSERLTDKDYSIEMQGEVCLVTFKPGTVVTPEMVKEAVAQERLKDQRDQIIDIWDFRGCTPSKNFTYGAIERFVEYVNSVFKGNWNSKTAFLVDENLAFGVTRMFLSLSERLPSEICVFHKKSDADEFVGLQPE